MRAAATAAVLPGRPPPHIVALLRGSASIRAAGVAFTGDAADGSGGGLASMDGEEDVGGGGSGGGMMAGGGVGLGGGGGAFRASGDRERDRERDLLFAGGPGTGGLIVRGGMPARRVRRLGGGGLSSGRQRRAATTYTYIGRRSSSACDGVETYIMTIARRLKFMRAASARSRHCAVI